MPQKLLAILAASTLFISACGSGGPVEAANMDQLHQHVLDAGGICDDYEDRGEAPGIPGSELRACNDEFVLAWFASNELAEYWSDGLYSVGQETLVGGTWAILAKMETLETLRGSLGGTIKDGKG
ncbi:hypothetical protein [Brevibacterium aurantiacum]|uniref:Uncharacterized protein n=1 Tax=Brevibacterium aurantiacum TaxID=273384 RepID=A0A2A3ZSS1_BREAU|nr:hypothetical protein [Brevibacterium aurantiacum]AZL10117.1 hypothetical protein CXR26_13480 [Brevibacterium aurantiacum]PCC54577.1 hypothetical protein CIK59_06060 [Brevibacterium aurantiacum]